MHPNILKISTWLDCDLFVSFKFLKPKCASVFEAIKIIKKFKKTAKYIFSVATSLADVNKRRQVQAQLSTPLPGASKYSVPARSYLTSHSIAVHEAILTTIHHNRSNPYLATPDSDHGVQNPR